MTFMQKILDALKLESTREMENSVKSKQELLTHKFDNSTIGCNEHSIHKSIINRNETSFIRFNLDIPEVKICAAILLNGSKRGSLIRESNNYALYFEGRYKINNISKLHYWLYHEGYLREATIKEALCLYKVPELKIILNSLGLKKTGKKADLIERIVESLSDSEKSKILKECKHLFLSEKGERFLEENYDLVLFHSNPYNISLNEYMENRFIGNRKRTFNDNAFQSLCQQAYTYQISGFFPRLEMVYHNLSDICYKEKRNDLALQYELYRLYFSTNLCSQTYFFEKELVKYNGIENCMKRIDSASVFNQYALNRIIELKQFFSEQLLDVIYNANILPYCLFGKYEMLDAVQDLYDNEFDAEFYTNIIRINYANYIKKFIK